MIRRRFLIFLLIFLVGILIFPQGVSADIQLSKNENHYLLNSVRQGLIDGWINITSSPEFSQPEKQAALFLIRNAIQEKELNFALNELPKDGLEGLVKIAISLYFNPPSDAGAILDKLEKESVKKAVEIATDWFLQNEIKVSSGKLTDSFTSYKGNSQEPVFYYNLAYRHSINEYGELAVEFYSPEEIEPKRPEVSITWLKGGYWDFEEWRKGGNEKIEPFIIKIKGKVRKTSAEGYDWEETLGVEIIFPESMPEMPDLPEESMIAQIPIIGDYYLDWKSRIEKSMVLMEKLGITTNIKDKEINLQNILQNIKNSTGNIISKIHSYIVQINPFSPATIIQQVPSSFVSEPSLVSSFPELKEIEKEVGALEERIAGENVGVGPLQVGQGKEMTMDLSAIQEELDEINEKIDIISQKTAELLGAKDEERIKEITEIVKIEEELDETEEPEIEEDLEELEQEKMGQEELGQNFCKNISGSYPGRNKVIINEIAWMGTSNSANDEWIELKNISGSAINLEGWQLQDNDGQIKIIFDKNDIISPNGFYLLERTDDNSVPNIIADFIYTGVINDQEEKLYLFNKDCFLEDEAIAWPDWPAGDKAQRRSIERGSDLTWHTYYGLGQNDVLGTPKEENSIVPSYWTGGGGPSLPSSEPSSLSSPPEVLITEVQIEGEEFFHDFIELYNSTSSLDISGFQLKKKTSSGKEYSIRVFPEGSIISGQSYFLWLNSEYASSGQVLADATSSQTLAKDNSIALFDKDKNILDSIAWGSGTDPFVEIVPFSQNPEENQNLGRKWDEINQKYQDTNNNQEDFEIQIPTPKTQNQSPLPSQNKLPIAQFFYSPVNPIVNQDILFDASSSTDPDGAITGYIWDFGDSAISTSTEATTTHSYSTSSDFLVSLTAFDTNNATNSATTTVTVSTPEIPTLEVVINEIAWMGTKADDSDEWIELYNNTDEEINLEGWKITAINNTPEIILKGLIFPKDYFLLERTDDQTISDIQAGQIYTGALGNEGEKIELRDAENNLVDLVDCFSGWFNGRNQKIEEDWVRMSMERIKPEIQGSDSSNWITNNGFVIAGRDSEGNSVQGTPKTRNSSYNFPDNLLMSPSLFQDTILTREWSPYIIKGILTVSENITLFIEPGVEIRFVPDYQSGMEVKGTLKAIGGEGNPIIFTSNSGDVPGGWETLYFTGPDSILDNVVIRYGGCYRYVPSVPPMVRGAVLVEGTDVIIRNSVVENNLVAGIWLNNSNSLIEGTLFRNNNQEYYYAPREPGMGITVALFLGGVSNPVLNSLTFEGNAVNIYPTP